MKALAAVTLIHVTGALLASTILSTQTTHDINQHDQPQNRLLGDTNAVLDTELDAWMNKFGVEAEKNGWLPQTESRGTEEIREDRRQRFAQAKERVARLQKENPEAQFSTDSPFSLMTVDEFAKFVKNAYIRGKPRLLREAAISPEASEGHKQEHSFNFHGKRGNDVDGISLDWANADWDNNNNDGNDNDGGWDDWQPWPQPSPNPNPRPRPGPVAPTDGPQPNPPNNDDSGNDAMDVDWAKHKCTPAIQNQGQCGVSWAFASVSAVETGACLASKGELQKLSEQHVASCDTASKGCDGGLIETTLEFMKNGVCSAQEVPYTSGGGQLATCNNQCRKVPTNIRSVERVSGEDGLISALKTGPVVIAVGASGDTWMQYRGGVLSNSNTQLDHAVVAVGYDANSFKIRNSWGPNWNESGYIEAQGAVVAPAHVQVASSPIVIGVVSFVVFELMAVVVVAFGTRCCVVVIAAAKPM